MSKQDGRDRWEALQAAYRKASDSEYQLRYELEHKYGSTTWATRTETAKLDAIRIRASKAGDKIMAYLDSYSPRNWHYGAPYWWICSKLSFEDATTTGPLAVIPPLSYGQTQTPVEFLTSVPERAS